VQDVAGTDVTAIQLLQKKISGRASEHNSEGEAEAHLLEQSQNSRHVTPTHLSALDRHHVPPNRTTKLVESSSERQAAFWYTIEKQFRFAANGQYRRKSFGHRERVFAAIWICTILALVFAPRSSASVPRHCFPSSMPALASLRYIAILVFWFSHQWVELFQTSRFFLMLSGFVLQFAEERRGKDMDSLAAYFTFLRRRLGKLYPIYGLAVVVAYYVALTPWCRPAPALLVFPYWFPWSTHPSCFLGHWFIPLIILCYTFFPILSSLVRKLSLQSAALVTCSTVILNLMECSRTLSYSKIILQERCKRS